MLLAAAAALGGSLTGAVAASARETASLRLAQPSAYPHVAVRFGGSVIVAVPQAWAGRRDSAAEATVSHDFGAGCRVHAYVSSVSTISTSTARAQLHRALAKASQPGALAPLPVRTVAEGRPSGGRAGAWEAVEPPAAARSFALFGSALLQIDKGHWAGITIGLVDAAGCGASERRSASGAVVQMLRTPMLYRATVSRRQAG